MNCKEELKKQLASITKKDIIGWSILFGIMGIAIYMFPITMNQSLDLEKQRISGAKTCADVFQADQVPFMSGLMIGTFDTDNSVQKAIDNKAHQLCKPLYDLQSKYGDLKLADIYKIQCSDLGLLIKTMPVRQEVINEYVSRCEVK